MKFNIYHSNAPTLLSKKLKKAGLAITVLALTAFLPHSGFGQYCTSGATDPADEDIGNVTFGSLNNGSATPVTNNPASTNTYTDFTSLPATPIMKDVPVPISVSIINSSGTTYGTIVNVFIDYNQNNVFDLPGERVFEATSPSGGNRTVSGTITVPLSAALGNTRMRVIANETGIAPLNPCGTYTWGETEDYTITITPPPVCTSPPNPGTISGNLSGCATQPTTLQLSGYTLGTTLQWQSSPDGTTWTDIAGATNNTFTTPLLSVSTYYRVNVTCNASIVASTPVQVVIGTGAVTAFPHTQNFDGANVPAMPCGWTVINANNDNSTWTTTAGNANSTPNAARYNYNASVSADDWLVSPALTFNSQNNYKVVFKYRNSSDFYTNSLEVRYGTSPTAAGMPVSNRIFSDPAINSISYLTGETNEIAPPTTGTYYVAFRIISDPSVYSDLFIDDVMFVEIPGCTGTPSAGNAAPGPVNYCPNSPNRLTVTGATTSPKVSYQWEEAASASGPWTNVTGGAGATTLTYTLPNNLTTTRYYRIKVTCGNSSQVALGNPTQVNITPSRLCYCANTLHVGECSPSDHIDSVAIAGTTLINGSSGCSNSNGPGYSKFPGSGSYTATLVGGITYTFSVKSTSNSVISMWIDLNQNGLFESSEWKQITSSSTANQAASAQFTIPVTARNGFTGMRIRSRGVSNPNSSGDACSPFGGGETEDYFITITGAVGVAEDLARAINVYPNPNNGKFKIEVGEAGSKAMKVELFNTLGQVVFADESKGAYNKEIDVTSLAAGIYILQVNADGVIASKRISIEK